METVKLMNMCRIYDKNTNKVLVQERVKEWDGIAFPGGKVETKESIVQSVKREVLEETGLEVDNLKICGVKDWYDNEKQERHLVILFNTSTYSGNLLDETGEGKNYWVEESKIKDLKFADDFDTLLNVFNNDKLNEMIYIENDGNWSVETY